MSFFDAVLLRSCDLVKCAILKPYNVGMMFLRIDSNMATTSLRPLPVYQMSQSTDDRAPGVYVAWAVCIIFNVISLALRCYTQNKIKRRW